MWKFTCPWKKTYFCPSALSFYIYIANKWMYGKHLEQWLTRNKFYVNNKYNNNVDLIPKEENDYLMENFSEG